MLIRLAALGFAAYKYLERRGSFGKSRSGAAEVRLAGGPLSDEAALQHDPAAPPAAVTT